MSPVAILSQAQSPERAAADLTLAHGDDPAWLDAFCEALDRYRSGHTVGRILGAWGMSRAEFGHHLGVSRQAVAKWIERGVPADRAPAIADLAAATDVLVRYLKRERIPAVVRRPADRLGGRCLVDLVAEGRFAEVLTACRAMFDMGDVHG